MFHEFEVKRRLLKVDKVVAETTEKKTIVSEFTLPLRAKKIFDVVARLNDVEAQAQQDGVTVRGEIRKQLFIVDEGDLIRHVDEEEAFEQFIQLKNVQPGMRVQVNARIVDVNVQLINENEVRQEIVLEIFVKVTEVQQLQVITDVIGGPKDLQVDKKLLKVDSVVGEDKVAEVIKETVQLPITAKKIYEIVPEVTNVQTEVVNDAVIVRGVVHKQIFLVDEGDLVRHVTEDNLFTVTVPIQGARPGMDVQVDIDAVVDRFQLIDVPGNMLRLTILLNIFVKVTEILQLKIVTDVKGKGIEVDKQLLKVDQVVDEARQREIVDSQVQLPIGAQKIFRIMGEITDVETEIVNGKVIVRAVLHKQIFLVDQSGLLRHVEEDVPFQVIKQLPDAEPQMDVQENLQIIDEIDFQLVEKKKLEQTAVVEVFVKVTEVEQLDIVVDVDWKHSKR